MLGRTRTCDLPIRSQKLKLRPVHRLRLRRELLGNY